MSISFERLKQVNGKTVQIPFSENLGNNFEKDKNAQTVLIGKEVLLPGNNTTNFTFEIPNCDEILMDLINSKNGIKKRIAKLYETGRVLIFSGIDNSIFRNNLILIDSRLPEILAEMLCQYYADRAKNTSDLSARLSGINPNGYDYSNNHHFYEYKIKRLLCEAALGMRPAEIWHGKYDATGGHLVVRQDGEIVCYHLYSHNQFENYLFLNTKFDTPSSSRHHFGDIYEENGKFFIKLNLQIRFS